MVCTANNAVNLFAQQIRATTCQWPKTLLAVTLPGKNGWSGFQATPEFNANTKIDESGYFYSTAWWENALTGTKIVAGVLTAGLVGLYAFDTIKENKKEVDA